MSFSRGSLDIDVSKEITRICGFIREMVKAFRRRGAVIGLSGGIDSAVVGELCVRALGKERVLGLLLPEKESNSVSLEYGKKQAEKMGVDFVRVDITGYLEALGLYSMRNSIIREYFPGVGEASRFHVTLPQDLLDRDRLSYYSITVEDKQGQRQSKRISAAGWLKISACQNMKQRTRMMLMYYHSEKNNYIVAGTTNKPELTQGFYVKHGDGGVDMEPIAHLYKGQVYQLARHLGVIQEIIDRSPSPDTYSLPVTDKEFYFCMDYEILDLLLYAYENKVPIEEVSKETGLKTEQINRAFRDFEAKERATWHLRQLPPSLIQSQPGLTG